MFNCDILNYFFKRRIFKLLFLYNKKNAYFPIASWLMLTLVFSLIYWIYVIHLVYTYMH